ncbi:ADP-ribosylation/Crystallin J1 [Pilobolus umbonatus]|nr:ADP-ribosylation/Crystallin J1 [Pilobolus umbonatus]
MRIPSGCSKLDREVIIDKVKGLVFGAILGDSLGLATEGLSRSQVNEIYNNGPIRFGMDEDGQPFIRDEYRSQFEENDFGDDAEQVLLLLESLLQNNGHFLAKDFASRLNKYCITGLDDLHKPPKGMNEINKTVINHSIYISNPQKAASEVWESRNHLRGANSVLVKAPLLGALNFWDGTAVIENSTECCRITHPDPRCMISCVIISTLIARLLRGQDLEMEIHPTSIPTSLPLSSDSYSFTDMMEADLQLLALVKNVIDTNKPMLVPPYIDPLFVTPETDSTQLQHYYDQLSNYSVSQSLVELELDSDVDSRDAFKCLSAAIYCFTRKVPIKCETEYFKKMLMDVTMQGGGADINATVVGSIMGARFGYAQLPTEWVVGLKRWEWLEDKIDEFCSLF